MVVRFTALSGLPSTSLVEQDTLLNLKNLLILKSSSWCSSAVLEFSFDFSIGADFLWVALVTEEILPQFEPNELFLPRTIDGPPNFPSNLLSALFVPKIQF